MLTISSGDKLGVMWGALGWIWWMIKFNHLFRSNVYSFRASSE